MSELTIRSIGADADEVRAALEAAAPAARIVTGDEAGNTIVALSSVSLDELLENTAAVAAYHRTRGEEGVPIEIVDRLLAGVNPVRVWREHRGLTLPALADAAGIGKGYLSQIETGDRHGTVETMKKLASALGVDLDDLT
jgi:DNA-binding XRE family transcriptional regulator